MQINVHTFALAHLRLSAFICGSLFLPSTADALVLLPFPPPRPASTLACHPSPRPHPPLFRAPQHRRAAADRRLADCGRDRVGSRLHAQNQRALALRHHDVAAGRAQSALALCPAAARRGGDDGRGALSHQHHPLPRRGRPPARGARCGGRRAGARHCALLFRRAVARAGAGRAGGGGGALVGADLWFGGAQAAGDAAHAGHGRQRRPGRGRLTDRREHGRWLVQAAHAHEPPPHVSWGRRRGRAGDGAAGAASAALALVALDQHRRPAGRTAQRDFGSGLHAARHAAHRRLLRHRDYLPSSPGDREAGLLAAGFARRLLFDQSGLRRQHPHLRDRAPAGPALLAALSTGQSFCSRL